MVPKKIFFVSGTGVHTEKLISFESALKDAGIERFNLVYVSSIFPPHCEIVSPEEGLNELQAGQIVHCVMARTETNTPTQPISAAIGAALPLDKNQYGYLAEYHAEQAHPNSPGELAEGLAIKMLAAAMGHETEGFDSSSDAFATSNIFSFAEGDAQGKWTTVVAAAVMVM